MTDIAYSLTVISLVSAVVLMISPDGSMKKYISLVLALTAIAYIGNVLLNLKGLPDNYDAPDVTVSDRTQQLKDEILNETKRISEGEIITAVCEKFNISREDISVRVSLHSNGNEVTLTAVKAEIKGAKNMVKITDIKYFLHEKFGARAEVVYKE